jgi:endoglucanase
MNKIFILNLVKYQLFIFSLLFCLPGYSQINSTVFYEEFESNANTIKSLWLPAANYSVTTGFSGNGLLFNSTTTNTNLSSSATIPLAKLLGATIAVSASIKGENLTGGGLPGMVIQMVAKPRSGGLRYYRIPIETGSFDWKLVGRTLSIDSDITSLSLNIGIYNATGKFWVDNIHIQVISEPMPPARDPSIVINKTHTGMYRGMNVVYSSDAPINIITKSSLDELSYDWKANSIRVMIGGEKYYPGGLQLADYDAIMQTELIRMDMLVKWCTANGLHMNVGLAGLSDGLFKSQAAQTRLINAWKLIATRYKNSSAVWAYDLANEPIASTYPYSYPFPFDKNILLWPSLAEALVNAIRAIDPVKAIIVESLNYSINLDDIKPIDASIPNIIYSAHMYQPGKLTSQFGPETPVFTYPGTIDGVYYDKAKLKEILAPLKAYQEKYRVPIYIGEFGCIRWAPNNSAYNYLRDCIEIFEEYNWDYAYNTFRTWNGWSVEHSNGYYDNVLPTTKTDRELLFRSYFGQTGTQTNIEKHETLPSIGYPNPVNDVLNLKLTQENNRLIVSDMSGKRVFDKIVPSNYKLDMSTCNTGVYIIRVENASGILNEKVMKK